MKQTGHRLTGLAIGLLAAPLLLAHVGPTAWLVVPSAVFGGTAPDRIEWLGHERWCEHRTITHWWPIWFALLGWAAWHLPSIWAVIGVGFALGSVSHLVCDWPNPTGIPILHPWRRNSLHLWRSGEHEIPILLVLFSMVGGLYAMVFGRV